MTCSKFEYPSGINAPVIDIKNLQIVNGGQTIHSLFEAFFEKSSNFENIDILCRIYQTENLELSTDIAEYTNSQNQVRTRDIRAIDSVQKKLEKELLAKGFYFERKKNQYASQPRNKRLDAEKVGQVLMAFYNQMPSEAKNKKSLIFSDKYEDVFNENINADKVLLAYTLYENIEKEKEAIRTTTLMNSENFDDESYILYASYYILYILNRLSVSKGIEILYKNLKQIWSMYPLSIEILKNITKTERSSSKINYTHATFFKSNNPKRIFEEKLLSKEFGFEQLKIF